MYNIEKILTLPESRTLEFKRDLSSLKPILKTLIAFANTAGGILLVGRNDDGNILGVENVFQEEEKLANAISDNIAPPLLPEIETVTVEGKSLLLVRVAHWKGPFYLKSKGPETGVYIRLGSTNCEAGQEQLAELKRSLSSLSFDQLPCSAVGVTGLDMSKIESAFSKVKKEIDIKKLETLGILVNYGGDLVCSNGGLILFGQKHLRELHFPNATVRCAGFRDTQKNEFIDQYDIEDGIIEAMTEVPKFMRRNTRMAAKIEQIQREDISEYSPLAVREVLTNALVHADYSIKGMNPRVAIFSDRLEIESPGTLPFGYSFDSFMAGVSHIRNKVISRVFRELKIMEEWGTGYKRIAETCKIGGYIIPHWDELGIAIRVTFKPHSMTQEALENIQPFVTDELTQRQKDILATFGQNDKLTSRDIAKRLGYPLSERTLRADLTALKNLSLLKIIGGGPKSFWMRIL